MNNTKKILAVDDEENILELIKYNLELNGFSVLIALSGEEALQILEKEQVDLMLLDLMLSGIDGLEVLKKVRVTEKVKNLPVIILTAKGDEFNKVIGLELGADDYVSKPFGIHELVARVKALLRRSFSVKEEDEDKKSKEEIVIVDDIVINKTRMEVTVNGKLVELSLKEFELLYLLAKHRGMVFTRENLANSIWGYEFYGETRTVDVHIRNLRKKIEKNDAEPLYIKTVRGVGYKFN